jgi:putative hemolysin
MIGIDLVIFVFLTLLNGFFALSEMALVSARKSRLAPLAESGDVRARLALALGEDPNRFLSAVQIGITVIGIIAGAASGAALSERFGGWLTINVPVVEPFAMEIAFVIVIALMTFFTLVFGELVPKRVAIARPEPIALMVATPITVVAKVASPFVALLSFTSQAVMRLLRIQVGSQNDVTEEEVKHVIAEGAQAGILDPEERAMLEGVMRVADRTARSIMTPRPDLYWLDPRDPPERIRADLIECPYSLLVVAEDDVDHPVGVLYKKDLLTPALKGEPIDVAAHLKKPVVVPETAPVLKLLDLFRNTPVHCAFVVDEYGGLEGLVTLTDIIEGIAGDLPDVDEPELSDVVEREDGSYLIDGDTPIEDLARILDEPDMPRGSYHTLGGLILSALHRIPKEGDKTVIAGFSFEVVDMDGRRIDKVLVTRLPDAVETDAA